MDLITVENIVSDEAQDGQVQRMGQPGQDTSSQPPFEVKLQLKISACFTEILQMDRHSISRLIHASPIELIRQAYDAAY